jgi:hypothetical protein
MATHSFLVLPFIQFLRSFVGVQHSALHRTAKPLLHRAVPQMRRCFLGIGWPHAGTCLGVGVLCFLGVLPRPQRRQAGVHTCCQASRAVLAACGRVGEDHTPLYG